MSGGVDSSVAAALLVQKGYDVTGAFMRQWSEPPDLSGVCAWKKDRRDALRVAAALGIPLITLNFEGEYKKWVMTYMFAEYKKSRTPNPDVLCNKFIKFGVWLKAAQKLGYNKLATGHYARLRREETRNKKQETNKFVYSLMEARDKNKDQTYFLHQLTQKQLKNVLFPIGGYTKAEVRTLARRFKLPTADKAESMGICFVGEVPMKEFLLQKIKPKKGKVVMSSGGVIGEHDGLAFYTIGQRHLKMQPRTRTVRGKNAEFRIQNSKPLYVIGKNMKKNELIVGFENDPLLYKKSVMVKEISWIGQVPKFPLQCQVRLRHRQPRQNVQLVNNNGKIIMEFSKAQRAATPGQFAVFYLPRGEALRGKNGECLGGGVIK